MLTAGEITTVVDLYLTRLSQGDLEGVLALYSDDATLEDPVGSDVRQGRASLQQFYQGLIAGNVKAERTGPICGTANEAAFPFVAVSNAGNETVVVEVIYHLCFDSEGRVSSMRAFWGPHNIKKQ